MATAKQFDSMPTAATTTTECAGGRDPLDLLMISWSMDEEESLFATTEAPRVSGSWMAAPSSFSQRAAATTTTSVEKSSSELSVSNSIYINDDNDKAKTSHVNMNMNNKVKHDYYDHARDPDGEYTAMHQVIEKTGGSFADQAFPVRLHFVLNENEKDGLSHIVSWQPHGRCFVVHDQKNFVETILGNWFRMSKYASFQRQLNIYGFRRLTAGPDKGGYYHELFLRGKPGLAYRIQRHKLKGTGTRKAASPENEPNFYQMSHLPSVGDTTNVIIKSEGYSEAKHPIYYGGGGGGPHPGGFSLQTLAPSLLAPPTMMTNFGGHPAAGSNNCSNQHNHTAAFNSCEQPLGLGSSWSGTRDPLQQWSLPGWWYDLNVLRDSHGFDEGAQ